MVSADTNIWPAPDNALVSPNVKMLIYLSMKEVPLFDREEKGGLESSII